MNLNVLVKRHFYMQSTEKIAELSRSKPRPIELIDSPRFHLSQISAR